MEKNFWQQEGDYIGSKHRKAITKEDVNFIREKLNKIYPADKVARAERLARRLIGGIPG